MPSVDVFKFARVAALAADEKKGEDILAIDVRRQSSLTDCFLFVTGTTHVHIRALEDAVREALKDAGASLRRTDGQRGHLWRALDYGALIVHIMDPKTREYYGMERLWEEGKPVEVKKAPAPRKRPAVRRKTASRKK